MQELEIIGWKAIIIAPKYEIFKQACEAWLRNTIITKLGD